MNSADLAKRSAPGSTALPDLQTMAQQTEALLGPLAGIDNDGTDTTLSFDQGSDVPATPVLLEPDAGAASPHAGTDQLVASGTAIIASNPLALAAYRTVFPGGGGVTSEIPREGCALLDTIAGTESPGYDVIYGGRRFTDFSHHPDIAVPIRTGPNKGQTSTAAGRYQFIFSTWTGLQRQLGLPDFSPASQDKAAWQLAQDVYQGKEHRPLLADLQNNVLGDVGPALHSTWTSLPGGIEQGVNANRFINNYNNNLAKYPV